MKLPAVMRVGEGVDVLGGNGGEQEDNSTRRHGGHGEEINAEVAEDAQWGRAREAPIIPSVDSE